MDTLILSLVLLLSGHDNKRNPFIIMNESVLHVLILWFFKHTTNNLYHLKFCHFITILFAKAPEPILATIIFKLNFISSLNNAYNNIILNEIPILHLNIDSLL